MRAARIISVVISWFFIVLSMAMAIFALTQLTIAKIRINSTIGYLTAALFFGALIWIPHRLKAHRRYALANWIAFSINILAALALLVIIYLMYQIEC